MEPVTLRTERLILSVPTDADVDAVFEACQDADIQRYTTVPSPYERHHAEGFIRQVAGWWDEVSETTWAIRHGDVLVGMIGLHRLKDESSSGELGYWMAARARGQGLLTEAAEAVVDWGFSSEGLGLKRLEWRAVAGNTASARSARVLGFRYEGTLRQAMSGADGRDDAWIAGLLPTDDRAPQVWPVLED